MRYEAPIVSRTAAGFSIIELLVVVAVIAILAAMSLPYIVNFKKLYKSGDQAIKVMDLMREAAQLALTRRRTMRLEIDLTDNAVLLIDERGSDPDILIKKIPLEPVNELRMDAIPATVTKPTPPNYTDITFAADTIGHLVGSATVMGHSVWAARFRSDGSVVNAAGVPVSVNIYIWPPSDPGAPTTRNKAEVRAITMFGGSGAVRYWKHNGTTFVANQ